MREGVNKVASVSYTHLDVYKRQAHRGFECFNEILDEYQPKWFIHGHVHLNYDARLPLSLIHI